MPEVYDKKGRPIWHGDLLRQFDFMPSNRPLEARHIYHVAIRNEGGFLQAVPFNEAISGNPEGGKFWLNDETAKEVEFIHGRIGQLENGNLVMWCERPKRGEK
jgi:hypothetical protein